MLKRLTNFVLGSKKSSSYPGEYASDFVSPTVSSDDSFEHSVKSSTV